MPFEPSPASPVTRINILQGQARVSAGPRVEFSTVLGSCVFGGVSGSAVADATALGGMLIPWQKREGYPAGFVAANNSAAASIAILIPPSIPFILYSLVSNVSIADLFLADGPMMTARDRRGIVNETIALPDDSYELKHTVAVFIGTDKGSVCLCSTGIFDESIRVGIDEPLEHCLPSTEQVTDEWRDSPSDTVQVTRQAIHLDSMPNHTH